MNKTIAFILALSLSALAHSEEKNHPCQKIKTACESAGFVKGEHKTSGKGLFADCMKKVMEGQSVAGVTVSSEDITACKTRKEEHQEKKAAKK